MKAAVFDGNKVKLKEVEKPALKMSQVLIEVKAAGMCGTDIAISRGWYEVSTPLILGHEFAGEVVEVGDNVDQSWVGKRVTSEINTNIDFDCFYCKREIFTQCVNRKAIGIDMDGAFAEYIAVNDYLIHEIPDTLSYKEATFIEPLAAAYQTFELMPIDNDDNTIAIFGLGKLGLLIVQVAKKIGLNLIVVDGSDKKLELAMSYGADFTINRLNTKNISETIKGYTDGIGADIVVDATGNGNALKDITASCRTRGKIHIKSTHGLEVPLNITDIVVREITIYTSRCGPFEKAIKGINSGEIEVKSLISAEYNLEEIRTAFDVYGKDRDQIKTIITIE